MAGIIVSEYTASGNSYGGAGMGFLNPKVHASPEAAAKDIIERQRRNLEIAEENKSSPYAKRATTNIEIHGTKAEAGSKVSINDIDKIKPGVTQEIKGLVREGLESLKRGSGIAKAVAGAGLSVAAGVSAAAEPGATAASVGDAIASEALPGWAAARQGHACKAFGEATGYVAQGLTITAGAAVTVAATAGSSVTGPGAVAVAAGGAALTTMATESAGKVGTSAGEAACEAAVSGFNKVKSVFGLGS